MNIEKLAAEKYPNQGWADERAAFIAGYNEREKWIRVEDAPLFTVENGHWACTEAGNNTFVAAVPYNDSTKPGKKLWWIRLCVIEDGIGLCVVEEDDNIPAGWDMADVTHYKLIIPPNQQP